jgi:spore coat polysaccharide biosynthesis predicted glycosyltransferase SpsG
MGGSDIANRTPTVIRSFDGFDLYVDTIIGPGFSEQQEHEVRLAAENAVSDVSVARNPDDLAERMFRADIAVSTASSTTYELLALGTPIVCQPIVENQEPIATALGNRDLATVVRNESENSTFQQAIEQSVLNISLLNTRRNLGRELIDGCGVRRIYNKLLSIGRKR